MAELIRANPRFREITEEWADLHDRKAQGYGSKGDPLGNLREVEQLGLPAYMGVIIRMGDKFARLKNVLRDSSIETPDETVLDTLNDIGVYSALARQLYEENAAKVLREMMRDSASMEEVLEDNIYSTRHAKACIYGRRPHPGYKCNERRVE